MDEIGFEIINQQGTATKGEWFPVCIQIFCNQPDPALVGNRQPADAKLAEKVTAEILNLDVLAGRRSGLYAGLDKVASKARLRRKAQGEEQDQDKCQQA